MNYIVLGDSKIYLAKKAHRCSWCGEQIDPKTRYRRTRAINDGRPYTEKLHPECDGAKDRYFLTWDALDGDGYMEGEMRRGLACMKGEDE